MLEKDLGLRFVLYLVLCEITNKKEMKNKEKLCLFSTHKLYEVRINNLLMIIECTSITYHRPDGIFLLSIYDKISWKWAAQLSAIKHDNINPI